MTVRFNTVDVDSLKVFYRSAGDLRAPTALLLHGFSNASDLILRTLRGSNRTRKTSQGARTRLTSKEGKHHEL